jgi:hypothetical protein
VTRVATRDWNKSASDHGGERRGKLRASSSTGNREQGGQRSDLGTGARTSGQDSGW